MLYSHDYKCIFIHIPKCAGTSIEECLELNFVLEAENLTYLQIEKRWHCSKAQTIQKLGKKTWESYFKFSFVRNPWDRIISAWRMFETKSWCQLDQSYSLSEFIDLVTDEKIDYHANYLTKWQKESWQHSLENVRHHTLPATHPFYGLVEDEKLTVDFCGRFENLQSDFAKVTEKLGVEIQLPHRLKTDRSSNYQDYFKDSALIERIRDYYQKDCELFEYEF